MGLCIGMAISPVSTTSLYAPVNSVAVVPATSTPGVAALRRMRPAPLGTAPAPAQWAVEAEAATTLPHGVPLPVGRTDAAPGSLAWMAGVLLLPLSSLLGLLLWRQQSHRERPASMSSLASLGPSIHTSYWSDAGHMAMATTTGQPIKALCPVADGSEDIEFTTITDVLYRAGVQIVVASVMPSKQVTLARGIKVTADVLMEEVDAADFDLVACAGGMPGAEHFANSPALNKFVVDIKSQGKLYAAICATPCVMFASNAAIMEGVSIVTSFPAFHDKLQEKCPGVTVSKAAVVVDGQCVTSQGPGTAMAFALKLVEMTVGEDQAQEIAKALLYDLA
uniref:DJ-1/PfpI domain-containing protein n=1 Tax=Eutreptiella gymnastica TaxID=73025 RepID=A0A7S1I2L4_9EUGL